MNEETKNAEIGRMTIEYAEIKKTVGSLNKSLHADADLLIRLAESIKGDFGPVRMPEGLDLAKVADKLVELSTAMSERTRLENRLREAGLEDLIRQ